MINHNQREHLFEITSDPLLGTSYNILVRLVLVREATILASNRVTTLGNHDLGCRHEKSGLDFEQSRYTDPLPGQSHDGGEKYTESDRHYPSDDGKKNRVVRCIPVFTIYFIDLKDAGSWSIRVWCFLQCTQPGPAEQA